MENEQPRETTQPVDADRPEEDYPGDAPEYRADVKKKMKSGQYTRGYADGQTVKVRETVGGVSRMITVTVYKGRERRYGWEYQLKTARGPLFGDGAWVKEDDLR